MSYMLFERAFDGNSTNVTAPSVLFQEGLPDAGLVAATSCGTTGTHLNDLGSLMNKALPAPRSLSVFLIPHSDEQHG